MSDGRDRVLGAVRAALGRGSQPPAAAAEVQRRIDEHPANVIPSRARLDLAGRINLFLAEAERVNATTARIGHWDRVPAAVAAYLKSMNLPESLRVAPDPSLRDIPWSREPLLEISAGVAREGDRVTLTGAFAAVAETGTLVLMSGPESPTTLNFLPEVHIVVLSADRVAGTYEDTWARIRFRYGDGKLPRAVNWITGPSRTGDIEQTLLLGAHGPRLLHIVLVDV